MQRFTTSITSFFRVFQLISRKIEPYFSLLRLSDSLDNICKELIRICGPQIFGGNIDYLREKKNIPLLMKESEEQNKEKTGYGMLDIVRYSNQIPLQYNVAAHGDPGLFSLSLKSTAPGTFL
jgi:hypothetical protein